MNNEAIAVLERPLVKQDKQHEPPVEHVTGMLEEAVSERMVNRTSTEVSAAQYCRKVPVIHAEEICGEVLRTLRADEQIPCIVIVDEGNSPLGLIMRDAFYRLFAGRFASDLFYDKPALLFAEQAPTVREVSADPGELIDAALNRQGSKFYQCMILTEQDQVKGVLTVQDLMIMSRSLQTQADQARIVTVKESHGRLGRIGQSVHHVSEAAGRSLREAEMMSRLVTAGRAELQQVKESFERLLSITSRQEKQVKELLERTVEISEITGSIRELADRSGLLAMNAAIEAAHAGEHGRGFAVVASEVGSLSSQTKKFSEEIGKTLQRIGEMVRETAAMAVTSAAEVEGSREHVAEADTTFESLVEAVHQAELRGREMHQSSGEAAQRAHKVMKELERLAGPIEQG
ncbi:methyl-accepting chemotaxis protein [Paenibacillus tuaregi]|uniref:methyl-accepting chemotaxis protein n=1 Tax=Paenibacillus tuaregi TaxID=1816681 RepID=UPI0008385BAB|nr:methyl-accepting chemotaxis protein [Paenibacillus tuaregi]